MKIYQYVPLNALKYQYKKVRAFNILQVLGGIQWLNMRLGLQNFMEW